MSRMEAATRLSDDARFELAMGAAAAERRNRPRAMVVVSCVVLAVALVIAAAGVSARASARRTLARDLADQAAVEEMAQEWERLDAQARESGDVALGTKIPNLVSKVEEAAARAGLKDPLKKPRVTPRSANGGTMNEYYYTDVKDPSLKALMEWLRLATTEIPGLEIVGVDLKPEATAWNMTVTLRRWERGG